MNCRCSQKHTTALDAPTKCVAVCWQHVQGEAAGLGLHEAEGDFCNAGMSQRLVSACAFALQGAFQIETTRVYDHIAQRILDR
jgi:hypothetical protein